MELHREGALGIELKINKRPFPNLKTLWESPQSDFEFKYANKIKVHKIHWKIVIPALISKTISVQCGRYDWNVVVITMIIIAKQ